jgi:chaperonin GroES
MKVAYSIDDADKKLILTPAEDGFEVEYKDFSNFNPLFNYVVIKRDDEKEVTKGGIFIPDNSKEKPSTGTVISIGNGTVHEQTGIFTPTTVQVGDRVFFLRLAGQKIEMNGEEFTIIKENEILGIIR